MAPDEPTHRPEASESPAEPHETGGTNPPESDEPAPSTSRPADPAMAVAGPSTVDAMGKDKRRQVVGHSYGPSRRQQLIFFGIVGAIVLVIWIGSKILAAEFDQPPSSNPDRAPWSKSAAPQLPPPRPF